MDALIIVDKNLFGTAYDAFTSILQTGFKRFLRKQPFKVEGCGGCLPELEVGYSLTGVVLFTALYNAGFKFRTFDNFDVINNNKEELIQCLEGDVKCIAISTTYIEGCARLREVISFVKKHNEQAKIIVGGPLLLSEFEDIYTGVEGIDYFVFGDGEVSFPKLVFDICNGLETIAEAVIAKEDGRDVPIPPKNIPSVDINTAPIPRWELIDGFFSGDYSIPTPTIEAV